jgi:hypothetical protein
MGRSRRYLEAGWARGIPSPWPKFNIEAELDRLGLAIPRQEWERLVIRRFITSYPGWSDEDLFCRPHFALQFAALMAQDVHCMRLGEYIPLRSLSNIRKNRRVKRIKILTSSSQADPPSNGDNGILFIPATLFEIGAGDIDDDTAKFIDDDGELFVSIRWARKKFPRLARDFDGMEAHSIGPEDEQEDIA